MQRVQAVFSTLPGEVVGIAVVWVVIGPLLVEAASASAWVAGGKLTRVALRSAVEALARSEWVEGQAEMQAACWSGRAPQEQPAARPEEADEQRAPPWEAGL